MELFTLAFALLPFVGMTGAVEIGMTTEAYYDTLDKVNADIQYYQENDPCDGSLEDQYQEVGFEKKKVYCENLPEYYFNMSSKLQQMEMKITGLCEEHFGVKKFDKGYAYCLHMTKSFLQSKSKELGNGKAYEELTKSVNELESGSDF